MAGRFVVKDSNLFLVPNNPHMLHLATIGYGLREFIVMLCIRGPKTQKLYIEELVLNTVDFQNDVFANCKFIQDDHLAEDLANFAASQGITDMKKIADILIDSSQFNLLPY